MATGYAEYDALTDAKRFYDEANEWRLPFNDGFRLAVMLARFEPEYVRVLAELCPEISNNPIVTAANMRRYVTQFPLVIEPD
jgi:hypothetical protein